MLKIWKPIILLLAITCITANTALAGGLSSRFVEVTLKDLVPGNTCSVKEETGKKLIVKNTTDGLTVDIEIEPEMPVDYNLVKGYEPIPDLAWIKIEKNSFENIGPNESAETDITITIPKDKKYHNKKYQVYIHSHTAGKSTFRIGLMSRLLLDTVAKPE